MTEATMKVDNAEDLQSLVDLVAMLEGIGLDVDVVFVPQEEEELPGGCMADCRNAEQVPDPTDGTQLAARIHDLAVELMQMREALDAAGVIPPMINGYEQPRYEYMHAYRDAVQLIAGGAL